jgi:DNA-directed RNA polymerase subunit omega
MIEGLKNDTLVRKIGGPYRLAALMQRRLKELIDGARPLVDTEGKNLVEIVVQEIVEDKIAIDYSKSMGISAPKLDEVYETSEQTPEGDR